MLVEEVDALGGGHEHINIELRGIEHVTIKGYNVVMWASSINDHLLSVMRKRMGDIRIKGRREEVEIKGEG